MKTIDEIQREIVSEFQTLGDGFEQYAYLIELSSLLPAMPEALHTEDRLVQGCQSRVWLDMQVEDGRFQLCADSDTLILYSPAE